MLTRQLDLSSAVDVYSDWIDACDSVAKETTSGPAAPPSYRQPQPAASSRAGLAHGEKYNDEDAGFIDDDGMDEEADYGADD
jgi:transcription elongation factor Elf1